VKIRPYEARDSADVAAISATCARSEADFALNPLWETESELASEFARRGIDAASHLWVADAGDGEVLGFAGFLRDPGSAEAGLVCPVVVRGGRRRGIGGELLRATLEAGRDALRIRYTTAGIGTRNRAGYSLLSSHGFRPVRQHFLMRCTRRPAIATPPAGLAFERAVDDDLDAVRTPASTRRCATAASARRSSPGPSPRASTPAASPPCCCCRPPTAPRCAPTRRSASGACV